MRAEDSLVPTPPGILVGDRVVIQWGTTCKRLLTGCLPIGEGVPSLRLYLQRWRSWYKHFRVLVFIRTEDVLCAHILVW